MNKEETCTVSACEYWTKNNNCKKCEHNCKYFGRGGCKLEWERCYKITDCYYKQNKMMDNALKNILSLDCKKDCKRQWDCTTCKMWQAQQVLEEVKNL